jgi:hypothetical protein
MLDERIARRLLISGNPREMAQEVICRGAPLAQGVARDEDWPKYAADVVVEAVRLLGNRKLIAPEWQKLNRDAEQAARAAAEADRETENRRKATLEKNKPATKQPELEQRAPSRELVSSQTLIRQMKAQTKERFAIPITKEVARAIEARVAQAQGLQQELAKLRCDEVLLEVVYADGVRCNSGVYDVGQIMGGVADVVDLLLRRPWLTWDYTVRFLPPCPVGKQWLTAHQMDQAKFTEFSAAFRPAFAVRTGSSPPCYYAAVLVDALMDPRENQKAVEMVEFEWLCSYSDRHCRFPHCNPGSGQGASAHFPPILPPGLPLPGLPVAGGQENVVLVEEDGTKCSAVDLLRRVLIDPAAAVPPPAPDQANPLEQKVVISIKQHDAPTAAPTLGPNIWGEQRKPEQASDKAPQGEEMTVGMPVWEQDTEGREDKKDQENALEHEDQRLVR